MKALLFHKFKNICYTHFGLGIQILSLFLYKGTWINGHSKLWVSYSPTAMYCTVNEGYTVYLAQKPDMYYCFCSNRDRHSVFLCKKTSDYFRDSVEKKHQIIFGTVWKKSIRLFSGQCGKRKMVAAPTGGAERK